MQNAQGAVGIEFAREAGTLLFRTRPAHGGALIKRAPNARPVCGPVPALDSSNDRSSRRCDSEERLARTALKTRRSGIKRRANGTYANKNVRQRGHGGGEAGPRVVVALPRPRDRLLQVVAAARRVRQRERDLVLDHQLGDVVCES